MPNDDLISRKALTGQIEEDAKNMMFTSHHSRMLHDDMVEFAINAIECAPAVDAEPVRHGRWLKDGSIGAIGNYCSLCDKRVKPDANYNYCPNCGAKMEKED